MINKLIEKYIKNLTVDDVKMFADKEKVEISSNEANIIYKYIKNNYRELLYGDVNKIFNQIKQEIDNDLYIKLLELYNKYCTKYKKYL